MALKKKLGKGKSSDSDIRGKFKKRDKTILEKTYNEREDRSKAGGGGKSYFNQEKLEEFNIKEYQPHKGDNYFEILPVSYESDIPYHFGCSVHFGTGIANDIFLCLLRYNGKPCYRCEQQQLKYREHPKGAKPTDEIKKLYPTDREIYLLWDRTEELAENKDPEYQLYLWGAPKTKVHAEIQILVRDKKKKTTLDISDVDEDGEGRTVNFEKIQKNKDDFPEYKGFSLLGRDEPIPDEVLSQLKEIIEAAEECNYKHPLEMFLHIPEYKEVKESMLTEGGGESDEEEEEDKPKDKKKKFGKDKDKKKDEEEEIDEDALLEKLEGLKEKLGDMNRFKFKKWCEENDYEDAAEMDKEEAIEAIVDDLYSKMLDKTIGAIPF